MMYFFKERKWLLVVFVFAIIFLLSMFFISMFANVESETDELDSNDEDIIPLVKPATNTDDLIENVEIIDDVKISEDSIQFANIDLNENDDIAVWVYSEPKFLGWFKIKINNGQKYINGLKEALKNIETLEGEHHLALSTKDDKPLGYIKINIISNVLTPDIVVYDVSFNTEGGSLLDTVSVIENSTISKPVDPTKDGYSFVEWRVDNKSFDFDTKILSDIVLTAVWEKKETNDKPIEDNKKPATTQPSTPEPKPIKTYVVTFNTSGGSLINAVTVNENTTVVQPANPSKNSHLFVEWQLDGQSYNFNNKINSNITLVAIWKQVGIVDTPPALNEKPLDSYPIPNRTAVCDESSFTDEDGSITVLKSLNEAHVNSYIDKWINYYGYFYLKASSYYSIYIADGLKLEFDENGRFFVTDELCNINYAAPLYQGSPNSAIKNYVNLFNITAFSSNVPVSNARIKCTADICWYY